MKDVKAIKEFCKSIFQFLYILKMLGTEVKYENKNKN